MKILRKIGSLIKKLIGPSRAPEGAMIGALTGIFPGARLVLAAVGGLLRRFDKTYGAKKPEPIVKITEPPQIQIDPVIQQIGKEIDAYSKKIFNKINFGTYLIRYGHHTTSKGQYLENKLERIEALQKCVQHIVQHINGPINMDIANDQLSIVTQDILLTRDHRQDNTANRLMQNDFNEEVNPYRLSKNKKESKNKELINGGVLFTLFKQVEKIVDEKTKSQKNRNVR